MRTITPEPFNVYTFDELGEKAQQKAIDDLRDKESKNENPWVGEWRKTLYKIEELFDIEVTEDGYGNHFISWRKWDNKDFGEEALALTGPRAMAYLWNNYGKKVSPGKYYGKLVPCEKDDKHPVGLRHVKYYSKCTPESYNCPLTGVCYDNDALMPFWSFFDEKTTVARDLKMQLSVRDVITECVNALFDSWENEEDYRLSDEGLEETIRGNDWEFREDGSIY